MKAFIAGLIAYHLLQSRLTTAVLGDGWYLRDVLHRLPPEEFEKLRRAVAEEVSCRNAR